MQTLDLTRVTTYPIAQRRNLVHLSDLIVPDAPAPAFVSEELDPVTEAIVAARREGRPVVWMMGAHVVKSGLSRFVIDLMARGVITHVAGNGAVSIHDFELALIGATSEDVATSLEDGTFGMADETGRLMHQALREGVRDGLGYGASIGRFIDTQPERFPHREVSILWNAYRLGIPATVHVTIGTDIIHQHPSADFTTLGTASGRDFLAFCASLSQLEGGAFLNFGSAVTGPEIFLKALTIVRNLGHTVARITTANFDLVSLGADYHGKLGYDDPLYYYRPRKNIVNRPASLGGVGYHITGDHIVTVPNLHHRVTAALGSVPVRSDPSMPASLGIAAEQILADLLTRHPALEPVRMDLARAFGELVHSFRAGGTLYLCGNGGSMADALHISGELLKSYAHPRRLPEGLARGLETQPDGALLLRNLEGGLRAVVLGANSALASAVANDRPDRDVGLAQELAALARPGDVLLAVSTSGKAANVAYAVQVAGAMGVTTIGLTGSSGERLAGLADIAIRVPAERTDRIQELHVLCYHALCEMLEVELFPS
ncbi:MAG: SIS domain-containing protein [Anaerolineae bacterium]|nr:SIS domain-containing protein [Anaerolineae bacterium]